MTVHELVTAAQNLSFEQRRALMQALFAQWPPTAPLAGSITRVGDLDAASVHLRALVRHSIQHTDAQLRDAEVE